MPAVFSNLPAITDNLTPAAASHEATMQWHPIADRRRIGFGSVVTPVFPF